MEPPPQTPATTDLDWEEVLRTTEEFEQLLAQHSMVDITGWLWPSRNPGEFVSRLEALATRIEIYGLSLRPPLRRKVDIHTDAGRRSARDIAVRIRRYAKRRLVEQDLYGSPYSLSSLHPLVWRSEVQAQWRAGKLRLALQEAASSLEVMLQKRLGSDLSGKELNERAFGQNGCLNASDFKIDTANWSSAQQGTRALGEASFKLIRNLATHGHSEPTWVDAFERLVVLSAYARLVEGATPLERQHLPGGHHAPR